MTELMLVAIPGRIDRGKFVLRDRETRGIKIFHYMKTWAQPRYAEAERRW